MNHWLYDMVVDFKKALADLEHMRTSMPALSAAIKRIIEAAKEKA